MPQSFLDPGIVASRHRWALAARGALALVIGLWLLLAPVGGLVALAAIIATLLAVDGVVALVAGMWSEPGGRERWIGVVQGLASLVLASLALALPTSLLSLVWIVAIWMVWQGAGDVMVARVRGGEPWLASGGAVSVVLGVVLMILPAIFMRLTAAPSLVTMAAIAILVRGLFLLAASGRRQPAL
ncbi:MAG TPA: DUF308 domain-containing protein [Magnetospirillum sp.]|jgi:uncharacterized membrane protein HdeD (DUF308 family)|nr:DUF308 domain-containing protein [Magnetospirillum sp.]